MDLKPIINDLQKASFTLPGIMKGDVIKLDEVVSILRNHLEDEESGNIPLKVRDGVKTDFTGLPLENPFNPDDYEIR